MGDAFERLARTRAACAAALDALEHRTAMPGEAGRVTWDAAVAVKGLEEVIAAFNELGDPALLRDEVVEARLTDLEQGLRELARVHAVLSMSVVAEKERLRDRLLLARTASRGFGWHDQDGAGTRCDFEG